MEISHLGNGQVLITWRGFKAIIGPSLPKRQDVDVIALTGPVEETASVETMVLSSPGEYEISGVLITGVPAQLHIDEAGQRGTIYVLQAEDRSVAVLANIAPGLSNQQLEQMGQVDVLVIPVGGKGLTLDAPAAAAIVSQIEPKVVIPVHYDDGSSKYEMPQDKVEAFLKELGATAQETTKYKVPKELPEEMAVVVIKPAA